MQPLWEFVNQQEEHQLPLFDLEDYTIYGEGSDLESQVEESEVCDGAEEE